MPTRAWSSSRALSTRFTRTDHQWSVPDVCEGPTTHHRDLAVGGEAAHRATKRGADPLQDRRRRDRFTRMLGPKAHPLAFHLQIRHITVQIDPIQTLIEHHMPVEHIVYRHCDRTAGPAPTSAVRGKASLVEMSRLSAGAGWPCPPSRSILGSEGADGVPRHPRAPGVVNPAPATLPLLPQPWSRCHVPARANRGTRPTRWPSFRRDIAGGTTMGTAKFLGRVGTTLIC